MVKLTELSSNELDVVNSNSSLSSHLTNVWENGSSYTPRSWLYEKRSPKSVLADWLKILKSELSSLSYGKTVLHFEEGYIPKFSPQGGTPPLIDNMNLYDSQYSQSTEPALFGTAEWEKAVDSARLKVFGSATNKRPLSTNTVLADMRHKHKLITNSGWKAFSKRNKPETIKTAILESQDRAWMAYPALTLLRNQYGKDRIVWMFPFSTNIVENTFVFPLMELARKQGSVFVSPWEGFDRVKQTLTKIWIPGTRAVGGDISAMDSNFKLHHSKQTYRCIKPIFQSLYGEDLLKSIENLHTIEVIVNSKQKITGDHGVASGSGWTQFVETIFQCILLEYLGKTGMVLGDDSCIIYPDAKKSRASEVVHSLSEVSLPANEEKQSDEENSVVFLQRIFIRGVMSREDKNTLAGIYSTVRALTSMIFPERFYLPDEYNSDVFCIRIFMILENCVDSPLFEKFCDFVDKGQKDLIPFAKKSSKELDFLWRKSKSINNLVPSYNQEKLDSSLSNFASIRYVSKL